MASIRISVILLAGVFVLTAGAQTISAGAGTFIDISTTGGTAITNAGDDTGHPIITSVGNSMFPAGQVSIGNNGYAAAGDASTFSTYSNTDIALTGVPGGLPTTATGIALPHWDDLYPDPCTGFPCNNPTCLWWQEDTINGILCIMWKNENHFADATPGDSVQFEMLVYANPGGGPWIQYLYNDTVFGGAYAANDNGANATVGYVGAANPAGNANCKWSYLQSVLSSGVVLNLYPRFSVLPSSPGGAGTLQISIAAGPPSGAYFLAATLNAGNYPNGWFLGLDISFFDLASQINTGWPFYYGLDFSGSFTIGPVGLPTGLTFYAVALAFPPGSQYPSLFSPAFSYTIP